MGGAVTREEEDILKEAIDRFQLSGNMPIKTCICTRPSSTAALLHVDAIVWANI